MRMALEYSLARRQVHHNMFWQKRNHQRSRKRRIYVLAATLPLLLILIPAVYFGLKYASKTEAVWLDDSWAYRKKVPVTAHTPSAETDKYFSVTIDTSDTTRFQADCGDMRFTDVSGKVLQYYIASGCSSASTVTHVLVPSFPAGATDYYLYYGNPNAPNGFASADFSAATGVTVGTVGSEEKGVGPIAYWSFDEGSGSIANDGTSSGDGATFGASTAAPTWQNEEQCISSKCLYFDGSNDYAEKTSAKNLPLGASARTIEAWVRYNGSIAYQYVMSYGTQSNGNWFGLALDSSGKIYLDTWANDTAGTNTTIDDNKWHHIAAVYNGATSVSFYVDGVFIETDSIASPANTTGTTLRIGSSTSNDLFLKGYVDELKVYSSARSAAQIKAAFSSRGGLDAVSSSQGAGNQKSLSDGLVGYWKMEESATPALDSSGNAQSGTWTASPTVAKGKFGSAISLASASSQYITIADTVPLSPTTSVSVSAWINPTTNVTSRSVVVKDTAYRMTTNASSQLVCEVYSGGAWQTAATGATTLTTGSWQHIACTYDGKTLQGYVNGILDATSSISVAINDSASAVEIGRNVSANYFNGAIDEVHIYNRALSAQEVRSLYNFAPGPFGYWPLDEQNGTTTSDKSGNGNTGTLTASPSWASGKFGSAIRLNGSTQYVNMGDVSAFDFADGTNLTMEAWVYRSSVSTDQTIVSKKNCANNTCAGYEIYQWSSGNGGNTCLYVGDGTDQIDVCTADNSTVTLNTWYHIAAVFDESSLSQSTLYINGVNSKYSPYDAGTIGNVNSLSSANSLIIGAQSGPTMPFNGIVDDVKIYNYVRTPAQIIEDMNASHPLGGSPIASQLVYWPLDEQIQATNYNMGFGGSTYDATDNGPQWSSITVSECKVNGCLKYVNSTDYTSVADSNLGAFDSLTGFATSFWIKPNTMGTNKSIISKNNTSQKSFAIVTDASDNTKLRVHFAAATAEADNTTYCTTDTAALTVSTWQHFVVSYDGTQGTAANRVKIYKNGKLINCSATGTFPTAMTSGSTSDLRIGDDVSATYGALAMFIDEVKIYNASLTPDQATLESNFGSSVAYGVGQNEATQITNTAETPPVMYLPLDGRSGTTANDSSGNGNNATLTNGPAFDLGKIGGAIKFDGTDDRLQVGTAATLNTTSGFTIESWIYKTGSIGSVEDILFKGIDTGGTENTTSYLQLQTTGQIETGFTSSGTFYFVDSTTTLSTNTWYHIVGTYSNANNRLRIYINGKLDASATAGAATPDTNGSPLLIGVGNTSSLRPYAGRIDDVKLYNYERTPAQVAYDYNRGAPIGWWQFDDCQGAVAKDASGNGNDATLTYGGGTYTQVGTCNSGTSSDAWYGGATGRFNGGIAIDTTTDTISIGNISRYDFERTDPFSTSIWFKTSSLQSTTLFSKQGSGAPFRGWNIQTDGAGSIYFQFVNTYSSNILERKVTASTGYNDNNWHHVVTTYDGSSSPSGVHIYFDGKDQALTTDFNSLSATTLNSTSVYIGSRNGSAQKWSGLLDDARLYNYELSSTQVKKLYNGGSSVNFGPSSGSP